MANTITYNANMQAPLRTFWLDDDIEEIQQMTAAFLTDRYDNGAGAYVATPDDIAELEKATAAFLADRYDGECLCWDEPGHGLLLPGEQFLLPVSAAVAITRAESAAGEDLLSQIDELLHEQMEYEDVIGTAFLDAAHKLINVSGVEYTSFDKILGPNLLPNTPPMGGRTVVVSFKSELTNVAMEAILNLPDELDRILGIYEDTDDDDSDEEDGAMIRSDSSTVAFDPHTVLSHSQASYAASFFDPDTQTMVPYASLDSILLFEEQHGEFPTTLQVRCEDGDNEEDDEDEELNVQHTEIGEYFEHLDDDYTLLEVSTVQYVKYSQFNINTFLSPIREEHEPSSAASDCGMDFTDLCGSVMPLAQRQQSFLDDDISVSESSSDLCEQVLDVIGGLFADLCEEALKAFDGLFTNEIWKHEPDLEFSFADDIGANEAYLELAFSA